MNIFNEVDKFFRSLSEYLDFNYVFIIFVALFLLTVVIVLVSTSHAYESKLIKAVDKFNTYFMENPQITQENLIAFNDKMKNKNVPKQLRKQWQQFVLYRDKRASEYMSFELCVSAPLRNSTFKRDITTMNIMAYILSALSLVLNIYRSYETDMNDIFKHILLCPIIILTLNFIVTIFLNIHHSSIVNDLHQNYQFFEVNIDKATQTLPEYVDYEVLFDRMEIKRGIPILYAYLQKRAEEEQKELDRARLRNVEHEKFNFDESGVESSLVLDRAMEEAENYIAERKKFYEDMAQINDDITQEELNFREITKEYQRQNQVSKEAFENFKSQLAEATSSIEINYLKKQQQQELDRQRNLERDFDTASERHKKVLEGYQEELTGVENEIKKVKQSLEKGMMSEFKSYSMKVYEEASKVVEDVNNEEFDRLKNKIKQLLIGFLYAYVGLVLFLTAANASMTPLGKKTGLELGNRFANTPNEYALILIGFGLGIVTILCEPAVHVLTGQIEEMSDRRIKKKTVLIALAIGVGVAIGLAVLRTVYNFSILYIVIPGYAISFILMAFCPDLYTAIAFDSGGTASGPMAVSFVGPFVVGLTYAKYGPNADFYGLSFGVVALIALTPIIAIQVLGVWQTIEAQRRLAVMRQITKDPTNAEIIHY